MMSVQVLYTPDGQANANPLNNTQLLKLIT